MADETIAIIGSGGIGGYLAGTLGAAGRDVCLCVRTPFDRLTIEDKGSTFEPPVRIVTDPGLVAPVRWIMVTTKAQDTASAAPWFRRLVGPGTTIVVVQNGLDLEERVKPFAGGAAILPSVVYCSAERTAPGRIVHHSSARLIVPQGEASGALAALFAGTPFTVEPDPEFRTAGWRKLFSNIFFNPITALTLRRGRVFQEAAVQELVRALLDEALAVAVADGAKLTEGDVGRIVAGAGRGNPDGGSSMLYDRLAGPPARARLHHGRRRRDRGQARHPGAAEPGHAGARLGSERAPGRWLGMIDELWRWSRPLGCIER